MKKLLSIACVIALTAGFAQAQGVSIGARAGLNFASLNQSGASYSTRTSFLLGGYASIMFSGKIGIQPELYYNSVGAKEDDPTAGTTTLKLDYISVPVLFRYNFTDMIHLLVGPQIGILASAKAVNGGNSSDFKDSVNSSDFSGVVGLGADFGPFNAGLRYTTGLSNIAKNTSGGSDVKTSAFQIVAGYKLFGK